MGLNGNNKNQINLAGKYKNSLKKIEVSDVYYCGDKVKNLRSNRNRLLLEPKQVSSLYLVLRKRIFLFVKRIVKTDL
jgi:hypothetical protein